MNAACSRPVLTSRSYLYLAFAFLALAVYGSLVPFHFRPLAVSEAIDRFQAVCQAPVRLESRSDWVANVLLTLPLGYCLMGVLGVDRSRSGALGDALVVLPCCVATSAAIEFAQLFFPPRVSSLNDIVAQFIGACLGAAAWAGCGQRVTLWARRFWSHPEAARLAARLFPGYLAVLVLVHVIPLDLTISPADLYHKYQEGRIQLVPFGHPTGDVFALVQKGLLNVAYFLPAGLLLAGLPGPGGRDRNCSLWVWGMGLALAGSVEALQLLVYSRFVDSTDVVTGSLAVLAGWKCGQVLWGPSRQDQIPEPAHPTPGQRVVRRMLLAGWLSVIAFVTWQPFDFTVEVALPRLQDLCLVPFADTFQGDYLHAFQGMVEKAVLYLPAGVLLAPRGSATGSRGFLPMLAVLFLAVSFEAGQLFLPSRSASLGDALVEVVAAWIGFAITQRVREGAPATHGKIPVLEAGPTPRKRFTRAGRAAGLRPWDWPSFPGKP